MSVQHICVSSKPTDRATRVAELGDPDYAKKLSAFDREKVTTQLNVDLATMREKGLCTKCGYPLDNSPPHPEAKARVSGLKGW